MNNRLRNTTDKRILKEWIKRDPTPRTTISFYRYVNISDPQQMRDDLYLAWDRLGVLGRIYVAKEGINAQFSVPTANIDKFRKQLDAYDKFRGMPFKTAIEDDGKSFYKLTIKVRRKIVADGLDDDAFDTTNVGNHLTAKEWNEYMSDPETVVVDMRNHYESEIGHFKEAILPEVDTFREELQFVKKELADKKNKRVLLYCTGGVRCEKASAFLKSEGFKDVNQLFGGVIDYTRQCKTEDLENNFLGKNFVFDDRIGEKIGKEIIAHCHQCGELCDDHANCANDACHLLFIQCSKCRAQFSGCCSEECQRIIKLPLEKQKRLRKQITKTSTAHHYYRK